MFLKGFDTQNVIHLNIKYALYSSYSIAKLLTRD